MDRLLENIRNGEVSSRDQGRQMDFLRGMNSRFPSHDKADMNDKDEVDRLIAAWQKERPDLDFSPLTVLSRITRISKHLDIARRNAFAE